MSRSLLVALLFALLCLSFAASASADCLNKCSGNGECVSSTWCNCTAGYVGLDCAVKTAITTPLCWIGGAVCAWWGVQADYVYYRVSASNTTAAGWVGVMWNATDGMSYGQSSIFAYDGAAVYAFDGYNVKKGKPANLTGQSIAPQNVSGVLTASGGMEISFARALDTGLPQHYVIPAMKGMPSTWSVAYAQEASQHRHTLRHLHAH